MEMNLSIVATLYKSSRHIDEFHCRVSSAARDLVGDDYEIILVNDGSPDDSINRAVRLADDDSHVTVVDLSRNFGHHKAMMTGLAQSRGKLVFLLDSDLEEQPEWLSQFAAQLNAEECDVVYGIQASRKGGWVERWTGQWFYSWFRALSGLELPVNLVTARLMTRRYVDALLRHNEREVMIAGLWLITGFDQRPCSVIKLNSSASTYTFLRKIGLLVNAITSFSNAPLIGIFYIGVAISLISLIFISYLVFHKFFMGQTINGWTSLIVSVWLLGGLIISFVGIVGIYLGKIFSEVKRRPYTIIRQVYRRRND